jgi:hypothetical protein
LWLYGHDSVLLELASYISSIQDVIVIPLWLCASGTRYNR